MRRLERLEFRSAASHQVRIRFGYLRQLPKDYQGERHIVVAKHSPARTATSGSSSKKCRTRTLRKSINTSVRAACPPSSASCLCNATRAWFALLRTSDEARLPG